MASTSRTMSRPTRRTLLVLALAAMASAQAGTYTPVGCYTSSTPLDSQGYDTYQSYGACQTTCSGIGAAVMALTKGNTCYCGNELPAASSKTSSSACNEQCQGYPANICGGANAFSVLLTGIKANVPTYGGSSGNNGDSSSSGGSSSSPSAVTSSTATTAPTHTRLHDGGKTIVTSISPQTTIVVTKSPAPASASASPTNGKSSSGGGTNVAGIAAGVVVGVAAVAGIVAGIFFYLRHRRKHEAEEEYKRTQVSDFMRGGERKPPGSAYSQMSDSRLDPEAGARRNSHGSIADNQDYSRRILRVANPDRS